MLPESGMTWITITKTMAGFQLSPNFDARRSMRFHTFIREKDDEGYRDINILFEIAVCTFLNLRYSLRNTAILKT